MSRRDTYHDLVKNALIREGWTISHDPYFLQSDPKLSIDLGAQRTLAAERGDRKIAVEIKSFILLQIPKLQNWNERSVSMDYTKNY